MEEMHKQQKRHARATNHHFTDRDTLLIVSFHSRSIIFFVITDSGFLFVQEKRHEEISHRRLLHDRAAAKPPAASAPVEVTTKYRAFNLQQRFSAEHNH